MKHLWQWFGYGSITTLIACGSAQPGQQANGTGLPGTSVSGIDTAGSSAAAAPGSGGSTAPAAGTPNSGGPASGTAGSSANGSAGNGGVAGTSADAGKTGGGGTLGSAGRAGSSSGGNGGPGGGTGASSGGTGAGGSGGNTSGTGAMCRAESTHMGGLTQYDRTAQGNCGMPWPADDLFAAMATADYASSAVCGMCVEVTGPSGTKATIHVVDQCPVASNPKCVAGHIDLSHSAYNAVVPAGYVHGGEVPNSEPVSWRYVPCNVSGTLAYHFKDGSSMNWIAVQIRNSRYGIANLKYRKSGGSWQSMTAPANDLAYYVANNPGATSFDFQVTDINGQVLEDTGIQLIANSDVPGHAQFPDCKR